MKTPLPVLIMVCLFMSTPARAHPPWEVPQTGPQSFFGGKKITIEVKNASIAEVLKLLFEQSKEQGQFPEDFVRHRKLTAVLRDVPFELALGLVAEAGGLKVERKGPTWLLSLNVRALPTGLAQSASPLLTPTGRERIVCDACGKSSQLAAPPALRTPGCATCHLVMHPEWQFCPRCGTKREAAPKQVLHCPYCGKEVSAKPLGNQDSEIEQIRAELSRAEKALQEAQERLAQSKGKLLREQNEAAVKREGDRVKALKDRLEKALAAPAPKPSPKTAKPQPDQPRP